MLELLAAEGLTRWGRPLLVVARRFLEAGKKGEPTVEAVTALARAMVEALPRLYPPEEQRQWNTTGHRAAMAAEVAKRESLHAKMVADWQGRIAACEEQASKLRAYAEARKGQPWPPEGIAERVGGWAVMSPFDAERDAALWLAKAEAERANPPKPIPMWPGLELAKEWPWSLKRPDDWQPGDPERLEPVNIAPLFMPAPSGDLTLLDDRLAGVVGGELGDAVRKGARAAAKKGIEKAVAAWEIHTESEGGRRVLSVADEIADNGTTAGG